MLDLIQQNPLTSFVIFLISVIGGVWKVLEVLYAKPRDLRIAVLEKNIEEMRKEFQRSSRTETVVSGNATSTAVHSVTVHVEGPKQVAANEISGPALLNDMNAFCAAWKAPALTELEREHF